jgi:hypothetical protein
MWKAQGKKKNGHRVLVQEPEVMHHFKVRWEYNIQMKYTAKG